MKVKLLKRFYIYLLLCIYALLIIFKIDDVVYYAQYINFKNISVASFITSRRCPEEFHATPAVYRCIALGQQQRAQQRQMKGKKKKKNQNK